MAEITDPALELVAMCAWFANITANPSSQNTVQVFTTHFGGNEEVATPYTILGVVQRRFTTFTELLDQVDDPYLDTSIVGDARRAVAALRKFCALSQLGTSWSTNAALAGAQQHLSAVKAVSSTLRRSHPLRRLTKEEQEALREKLNDTLLDQIRTSDIPDYLRHALWSGLMELRTILDFLPVFGLEALAERASEVFVAHASARERSRSYRASKICAAIGIIIATATTVWVQSDAVLTATENHMRRAAEIESYFSEKLLLTGPNSHDAPAKPKPRGRRKSVNSK